MAGLAVAIPLATEPGPQRAGSSTWSAQTAAYVVRQAERSIAASAATDVEVARTIRLTLWSYGFSSREEVYAPGHRPQFDSSNMYPAATRGKVQAGSSIFVDYPARTWSRTSLPPANVKSLEFAPPASCPPPVHGFQIPYLAASVPWLRYDLRCGIYKLAGRQHVAGINAIKIVSVQGPSMIIWVSPANYLPVQSLALGGALARYRWLPVTLRSLALLNPPIPAGFRRVNG